MTHVPPNQRFYNPHNHHAFHNVQHPPPPAAPRPAQMPPQFRNPFLLFDDRANPINYNYIRPYMPPHVAKSDERSESLVMRRPRRTRTTFTSSQIAELEHHFLQSRYLTASRLAELAAKLALGTAQVKIWFKNRRRRQKIQMDQQRAGAEHPMSAMSPALDATVKAEPKLEYIATTASPSQQYPLSLVSNNNNVGVSPVLTPSPTPTTPNAANSFEHFQDVFTGYPNYANGSNVAGHHSQHNVNLNLPMAPMPYAMRNMTKTNSENQYCLSAPALATSTSSSSSSSPNEHDMSLYPQTGGSLYYRQLAMQQCGEFSAQPFVDYQRKARDGAPSANYALCMTSKTDPDMNFNNPFYMSSSTSPSMMTVAKPPLKPLALEASNMTTNSLDSALPPLERTIESADSPNSILYEPLTPKNDDSPGMISASNKIGNMNTHRNSSASQVFERGNETNGVLRCGVKNTSEIDNACRNQLSIGSNEVKLRPLENLNNDAYARFTKRSGEYPQTNYQCTVDTLMHSYMAHPHQHRQHQSPGSNPQFAYCFN